jgi:hypothetical protein
MGEEPDKTVAAAEELVPAHEADQPERSTKRTWFVIREVELDWLPVSEAAFLLWVLAGLLLAWLVVALVFVVR